MGRSLQHQVAVEPRSGALGRLDRGFTIATWVSFVAFVIVASRVDVATAFGGTVAFGILLWAFASARRRAGMQSVDDFARSLAARSPTLRNPRLRAHVGIAVMGGVQFLLTGVFWLYLYAPLVADHAAGTIEQQRPAISIFILIAAVLGFGFAWLARRVANRRP